MSLLGTLDRNGFPEGAYRLCRRRGRYGDQIKATLSRSFVALVLRCKVHTTWALQQRRTMYSMQTHSDRRSCRSSFAISCFLNVSSKKSTNLDPGGMPFRFTTCLKCAERVSLYHHLAAFTGRCLSRQERKMSTLHSVLVLLSPPPVSGRVKSLLII